MSTIEAGLANDLLGVSAPSTPHLSPDRIIDPTDFIGPEAEAAGATKGSVARRYRRLKFELMAADAFCLIVALLTSYLLRFGGRALSDGWMTTVLITPLIWVAVFHSFRLYAPQQLSNWEQFKNVISATGVGTLIIVAVSVWSEVELSRPWLGVTWLLALIAEISVRHLFNRRVARLRAEGTLAYRTLIVGTNPEAGQLAVSLTTPHLGFNPLGYVSVGTSPIEANGIHVLGHIDELDHVIFTHHAECLFVASSAVGSTDMLRVAKAGRRLGVDVRVSANVPEMLTSRLTIQPVGDTMSLALKPVRLSGGQALTKRIFDVVVASAVLFVVTPVLAAVAAVIKLTSPGPVLFKQHRVTKNGHVFQVFKFRTMRTDGDEILKEKGIDPSVPFFKLEDDPRITKIGNFIRRTSIDELPQLINVLRGEMSLVGPRPLPVDQVLANENLLSPRHEVSSGITGWWQVNGRSDVSPEKALSLDIFYIENWSLSLDLYIMLKTAQVLLQRKGAY
ncbi:MAG TPA: sugar transferase [Actinomycetota bacterium]|nr:sugar transferase [Actinomycetota bacterium]